LDFSVRRITAPANHRSDARITGHPLQPGNDDISVLSESGGEKDVISLVGLGFTHILVFASDQ